MCDPALRLVQGPDVEVIKPMWDEDQHYDLYIYLTQNRKMVQKEFYTGALVYNQLNFAFDDTHGKNITVR